mgnify:CR=1 FL=1
MSRSRKSSGSSSKSDTNSFQSLKSKILSDIENDSSQSDNFVSEPLDKEIQLVDNINNKINSNDIIDDDNNDTYYDSDDGYNDDDYSDDSYNDDDYSSDDNYDNNNDDYMDNYLSNNVVNDDFIDDNDSASDQELLRAYVGKGYEKIVSSPFNVFAFLFTIFYALYRKMYSYSLIILVIVAVVFVFIKKFVIVLIIYLVLAALVGFTINKVYISFAKRKINKIKQKNTNMHYQEIRDICSVAGGTSIRGVISIALIVCVCCLAILFVIGGPDSSLKENIDKIFFNRDTDKDKNRDTDDGHINEDYRGFISYDPDVVMKDEFSMIVPDVFVNESSSYNYYYKYYTDGDIFGNCRLKFGSVLGYSDPNQLVSKMIDYYSTTYKIDSPISGNKITINNVDWTWFFYKSTNGIKYFYATMKDKKVYLFSYEIDDNSALDECEDYKKTILNSIDGK